MDDDVDFDDLLGEERVVESMTSKRPKVDISAAPSVNEIRLGRRVLELERERETLVTELNELRSKQFSSPSAPPPAESSSTSGPITIPHELLPTLDILRRHIAELSRDNAALRYTFLGQPSTLTSPTTAGPSRSGPGQAPADIDGGSSGERVQGVDLEKVVQRVKAVMLENEELGAMVLEAGAKEGMKDEWQKALDESKAVIESLDSDLAHHLSTIQSLRAELATSKSQSTPSSSSSHRPPSSHSKQPSIALNPASSAFAPPRGLLPARPRERERTRDSDVKAESMNSPTLSHSSAGGADRRGGRYRDGEKDRDRDREREGGKEPPKGPREDRDVKRRR